MSKNYEISASQGCAVIVITLLLLMAIYFLMPYVCMLGWAPIATAFNLPTFTYWNWFWMSWLIRWLFKSNSGSSSNFNVREPK